MNDMIIKYVRNGKGHPVGCVIAKKIDATGDVYITGSLCRVKKEPFNKARGLVLAETRACMMATYGRPCPVANSLKNEIEIMTHRARRYFKDAVNFTWATPRKIRGKK
jgi:hypothetical protein